jgi:transposase-like protein
MRVRQELVIEPAQSWARLQEARNSEWFLHDLEGQMKENHRLFLEELMRYDRQQHLGVAPYERGQKRADQANGFYRRTLVTRLGPMELAVPRSRSGMFQPQILRRYQRREAAVDEALRKVFLLGVSTRQAGPALATLLDEAVSAATVSALCKVLDQTVGAWHRRALSDAYRYLIFDGVSVRIRLVGKVQRRMALCAYGIREDGQRELIDFLLVRSESEAHWRSLLEELWRRGLRGTKLRLISTDGHPGLIAALELLWPRVALQRCWAHKLRNVADKLKRSQKQCLQEAKLIYQAETRREAINRFRIWSARWKGQAERAVRCLEVDLEQMLAFYDCPQTYWKRLRTTNVIERLFVEVRRRIRTMCAFTTRDSCERILFSVFDRMNTHWRKHPLKPFTHNN